MATVDALKEVPLLSCLNQRELKRLARNLREQQFAPGTTVVREGKMSGVGFYIICDGEAEGSVGGEDVGRLGGVFRVTEGLAETFGEPRCFDTPLAESAIVGIAIGMAIRGFVPVPEIQFDGFTAPAFDQVVSHLAKYRMRTRGDVDMPVTLRIPSFGGIGAVEHHSESTESYWLHTAGLKVVVPSTPEA